MAESRYEKYVTWRAKLVIGPGPEGGPVKYYFPETFRIDDKEAKTATPESELPFSL